MWPRRAVEQRPVSGLLELREAAAAVALKLAQVLIGEIAKNVGIDRIVAKRLCVLVQTDPAEPTVDVQVQSPGSCQRQFLKMVESWRPP